QGFVSGSLVVDGDAAATATNILTHRGLFQLGFAVYLIEMACQIAMTALFYDLLKPSGRSVSLVAAFLGLTGCIIKTLSRLFFIAPLFILVGAHYLSVFSREQLQALALLFLRVNDHEAAIDVSCSAIGCPWLSAISAVCLDSLARFMTAELYADLEYIRSSKVCEGAAGGSQGRGRSYCQRGRAAACAAWGTKTGGEATESS